MSFNFGGGGGGGTGFNFGGAGNTTTTASTTGFSFGGTAVQTPATGGTGFTLGTQPNAAAPGSTGGFSFGAPSAASTPATGLKLGLTSTAATSTAGFSFGGAATSGTATSAGGGFGLGATTAGNTGFNFGGQGQTQTATTTTSAGVGLGGQTQAAGGFGFGTKPSVTPTANAAGGLTIGGAKTQPSTGFGLGGTTVQGTAAAAPQSTAFGLGGTPQTSIAGGLTLGGATPTATNTGGLTLGGSTQPQSTVGGLFAAKPAAAPASSAGFALGGGALKLPAQATTQPTAATISGASTGGLTLGAKPATGLSAPATSTTGGLKLGTATTSSGGFGLTLGAAAATTQATSGFNLGGKTTATTMPASLTTATSTTQSAANVPQMNYRQLEESINKWTLELEEQEKVFLDQATQVNAWDRLLIDNGEKITQLNTDVERVKIDQTRLDQELDFINAQQRELEDMLQPLEQAMEQLPPINYQQHADLEREHTYKLSENIDAQLKQMSTDLKEIIEHINSNNANQDRSDPVTQIAKILNAHIDSLQWVDQNTSLLQRRVDEVAKLADLRRKDQERNFRLAYD